MSVDATCNELLYEAQVNVKQITKIRSLQKKAVRIVGNGNFRAHSEPIFSRLEFLKLEDLYKINVQSFMYGYFHSRFLCLLKAFLRF